MAYCRRGNQIEKAHRHARDRANKLFMPKKKVTRRVSYFV